MRWGRFGGLDEGGPEGGFDGADEFSLGEGLGEEGRSQSELGFEFREDAAAHEDGRGGRVRLDKVIMPTDDAFIAMNSILHFPGRARGFR